MTDEAALKPYDGEEAEMLFLIHSFWLDHNGRETAEAEDREDLRSWTAPNHRLEFICLGDARVGFVHLCAFGGEYDWIEDLFVLPEYQRRGIGSRALRLLSERISTYSSSMYISAAARNAEALRLYRKMGFDCLNTVSLRMDFQPERYRAVDKVTMHGLDFEVRAEK